MLQNTIALFLIVVLTLASCSVTYNCDKGKARENFLFCTYYDSRGAITEKRFKHLLSGKETVREYYDNGKIKAKGKSKKKKTGIGCVVFRQEKYGKWKYWDESGKLSLIILEPGKDTLYICKDKTN